MKTPREIARDVAGEYASAVEKFAVCANNLGQTNEAVKFQGAYWDALIGACEAAIIEDRRQRGES